MQSSAFEARQLLSRFPGPVTLSASRAKFLLVLLTSLPFAAGGYWLASRGDPKGWLLLVFSGLCSVLAALQLLPGSNTLTLDGAGFEVKAWSLRRRTRWRDVTGFEARPVPQAPIQRVFYFNTNLRTSMLAKINVMTLGSNAALPDTYGLAANDLARLMTVWQDRAQCTFGTTAERPLHPIP